jgi:flagellar basal-body rod protein FlgF
MDNPVYVTVARQTALQRQMDVVANNIANANTAAFKREGTLFAEVVERLPEEGDQLSMGTDPASFTDLSAGPISETGDPLSVAILSDGMLPVERRGETVYTRDGRLALSPDGELTLLSGDRVLDAGGSPIQVPPDAGQIAIARDGTVSADGQTLGKLNLFHLDTDRLERVGNGLFRATEPPEQIEQPRFAQGFVEASNVNPIVELVRMIEIQRAYEMGQNLLQAEHDRISEVTNVVGSTT